MAQAWQWDPLGHRWGRGAHWPLLCTVGTHRYRSKGMQERRRIKNKEKQKEKRQGKQKEKQKTAEEK